MAIMKATAHLTAHVTVTVDVPEETLKFMSEEGMTADDWRQNMVKEFADRKFGFVGQMAEQGLADLSIEITSWEEE